jgi:hypothetical protein
MSLTLPCVGPLHRKARISTNEAQRTVSETQATMFLQVGADDYDDDYDDYDEDDGPRWLVLTNSSRRGTRVECGIPPHCFTLI